MPVTTLRMTDESATGEVLNEVTVSLNKQTVTVEDLITYRVAEEVEKRNSQAGSGDGSSYLVQPTDMERTLNQDNFEAVDPEKQAYVALTAFQRNGFFVFVDDCQADNLAQEFKISPDTKVCFVKLTPLAGG